MLLTIPDLSLVVLVGPSGSGKSSFARQHFKPTEVLSSDHCRGLVAADENAQDATPDAFAVLHFIAARRRSSAYAAAFGPHERTERRAEEVGSFCAPEKSLMSGGDPTGCGSADRGAFAGWPRRLKGNRAHVDREPRVSGD